MTIQKHYKTCLYIHGLHSKVHAGKKAIMEKYFKKVIFEDMNYGANLKVYGPLRETCLQQKVDLIIGSSFGGLLGYYLAGEMNLPCILFNPALFYKEESNDLIPEVQRSPIPYGLIISGEKDTVVSTSSIEDFLKASPEQTNIDLIKCSWLEHRIDTKTFEAAILQGLVLSER